MEPALKCWYRSREIPSSTNLLNTWVKKRAFGLLLSIAIRFVMLRLKPTSFLKEPWRRVAAEQPNDFLGTTKHCLQNISLLQIWRPFLHHIRCSDLRTNTFVESKKSRSHWLLPYVWKAPFSVCDCEGLFLWKFEQTTRWHGLQRLNTSLTWNVDLSFCYAMFLYGLLPKLECHWDDYTWVWEMFLCASSIRSWIIWVSSLCMSMLLIISPLYSSLKHPCPWSCCSRSSRLHRDYLQDWEGSGRQSLYRLPHTFGWCRFVNRIGKAVHVLRVCDLSCC